ncbi:NUDIX hydrolase [Candidatus Paracaedibacter symbiosus]|uniref:NUDIX hydrolase n=1 Tax=Candidatus Paracaedibacter symbiosus TaxID=244582 RepID=UPI000509EBBB|nr:NUDIX domain-containing protein [Candidatus Paracaedibacter symbiosus]
MQRFNATPSVYVLFRQENSILLGLRQNTPWMNDWYGLVSGHVEENETVVQAAIREVYEEAGVILQPTDLKLSTVMYRKMDRTNVDFFFVCDSWQGEIQNSEPDKCAGWSFFDKDALPDNTIDYLKIAINHCFNGGECLFIEYGFETGLL